ncbi:acyl-CoA dehydrogenase [Polaromonas sp. CF318]|uniref:acyl-CoA dehydrogenase n=1 Tax=Polaromonas sp. CF318 TaxID=1144318 RepID=UPI000270DAF7|nr:acyl-CoA dehydrogenase [Polaromonas sp. CF318]EJL87121.1 acyl-CoA dehydrogenase [Polaromonas sp. CF318]
MSEYVAPLKEMQFVLRELVGLESIAALPGHEEVGEELAGAILEEASKFAAGVLSPLNAVGDREGARWVDGEVRTAPGWKVAYDQFCAGGWHALSGSTEFGGQGLPRVVSSLAEEMWNGANMAFAVGIMLTRGAIEALELCGSDDQKAMYLPRLVSGEWTGTMNLTEPQAGSDLSAVRSRAVPQPDGSYKVHGQKIFITYGEHDLTPNIVHLVLARTPGAPEGVKGISLFVVPKFLVNRDGSLGRRNDVRCVSIEHKLGIHASPTAVLAFGDNEGATGWLIGKENHGLEYMFIMMNAARYSVGLEGVGLCERAYQRARDYARGRLQGVEPGGKSREKVAIVRHPDVRRMLLEMKSRTESLRVLASVVAEAMDVAHGNPDEEVRRERQAFVNLMIPVVKGWSTETSVHVASLGIQIHGGMGYIEETGAAQHLRDARITTIYEGTTGIQAADLIGRKITRDGGHAAKKVLQEMSAVQKQLKSMGAADHAALATRLLAGISSLRLCVEFILDQNDSNPKAAAACAVPMLELFGIVAGGWQMARAALAAHSCLQQDNSDAEFLQAKQLCARFYADHVLSKAPALADTILHGADAVLAYPEEQF